jgi:phenylacetate-CoA ligase
MRNLSPRELAGLLRTFLFGARFLQTAPGLSRDEMLAWQWRRVTRLVRHAWENVPFYRDHYSRVSFEPGDLKSWDDFHRLPTLTKDAIIANFPARMLARGESAERLIVSRSSGSTGKALDVAYDAQATALFILAGLRLYRMGFPYRAWHRQLYVYTSPYPLDSLFGLFPLHFVPTLAPVSDIVAEIRRRRPDLLVCYPSHLKQIAQAIPADERARLGLQCISVNSEMSTQAERDDLSRQFGCPVLDEYSSEELTRIAAQCRHGAYHVFEDINYLEAVPSATGDSLLVGTNLHNFAMPIIRYEQNDIGSLAERPCACGWKFRHLTGLQGRKNDSFTLPGGRTLSSGFLLDATYEVLLTYREEVRDFCLIQQSPDVVLLEIVPGSGWSESAAAAIRRRFQELLGSEVSMEVRPVEVCTKTKSVKRNPIISLVGRANSAPAS